MSRVLIDSNIFVYAFDPADLHRVSIIYTEDFQHGRDVEGVRFVNPFVA